MGRWVKGPIVPNGLTAYTPPSKSERATFLMSKTTSPIQNQSAGRPAVVAAEPREEVIRDYAYQLYQQGSGAHGYDVDHWLEATACLKANIPAHSSRSRLHQHLNGSENGTLRPQRPLVSSPAVAEEEIAGLRRGREALESSPSEAATSARATLI
jgi:hypothetical protein